MPLLVFKVESRINGNIEQIKFPETTQRKERMSNSTPYSGQRGATVIDTKPK